MKEKPFALIGVDCVTHDPESLKKVVDKEELNWRSFADNGDIFRAWNFPATPTFYIIDHTGIIRRKWVGHPGEKTLRVVLSQLIPDAEKAGRN